MNWDPNFQEKILRMLVGHDRIERLVDRRDTTVPETFVPSATRFAIVCELIQFWVHPRAFLGTLGGWSGRKGDGLYKIITDDGYVLAVRRYEGRAGGPDIWGIERLRLGDSVPEVLVIDYGPTPIFHQDAWVMKTIAKRCHPCPREEARLLCWIPITGAVAANSANETRSGDKRYVVVR
jgi:hypothetical protein